MNKKRNCFFTLVLLFSFIISGPKQHVFAQSFTKADLTFASTTTPSIDGNVVSATTNMRWLISPSNLL